MPNAPIVARTRAELAEVIMGWRRAEETHALVPTMGALHEGHLALVRLARTHCPRVVASIFVNPAQFGPNEDLTRYPRDEAGDIGKLASVDCDAVWAPHPAAMYPFGFATKIVPDGAALGLESDFRPAFFSGVATVCCKLFTQVAPQVAVFGEKDYQQFCVVRQMVRDLDLPLTIAGAPTVRERDGLAMSSRNRYLTPEDRQRAPGLYSAISRVGAEVRTGGDIAATCSRVAAELSAGGFKVDYLTVRNAETLANVATRGPEPLRVLAAAWLGNTRLIDNLAVSTTTPQ